MKIPVLKIRDEKGNLIPINAIRGASAYEQAVEGGYKGTKEEFLAFLNGLTEDASHYSNTDNPHKVTKTQIGLGNVEADTGGAVGRNATSGAGGAVGANAKAGAGGAVGGGAETSSGGAIGQNAKAGTGFSGGAGAAVAMNPSGNDYIDAIQLGAGTNSDAKTLQVYSHQLMDKNGMIPNARLPIQILSDSYVGSGKSGANSPNKLTVGFKPLFIRVTSAEHLSRNMIAMYPEAERRVENGYDDTTLHFTWGNDSVSWYSSVDNRPLSQFNGIDIKYDYFVIGVKE